MELKPDGSGVFAGENVHWEFNQGVLTIAWESGSTHMYNATITASALTLSSAGLGRPITFRRVGAAQGQDDPLAGAIGDDAAAPPQTGGRSQGTGGLVGKWQGKTGVVEIRENGTFVFPGGQGVPFTIQGDVLNLQGTDGVLKFRYNLTGDSLSLTAPNGQTLTFA